MSTLEESGTAGAPQFLLYHGDHVPDEERMGVLGSKPPRTEDHARGQSESVTQDPRAYEVHPLPHRGDERALPEEVEEGLKVDGEEERGWGGEK